MPPAGPLGTLARVLRMSADAKAWLATAALLLGGGWITAMNLWIVVGALRKSGGHASLSPLLGGLLCSLALLACPVEGASSYAWIPLLIDPGCAYSVLSLLYAIFVLGAFRK